MDPQTEVLLKRSADDEITMLLDGIPEPQFGFHAQQSLEKLLKALLAQLGESYPLTHHLDRLQGLLASCGEQLPLTPMLLSELNAYAVIWRYDVPPPSVVLNRQHVAETVRIIREHVVGRITALDISAP